MKQTPTPHPHQNNQFTTCLGIDVSKNTLDGSLSKTDGSHTHFQIKNSPKEIIAFLKKHQLTGPEVLIAMENTGRYNWPLYQALTELKEAPDQPFEATVFVLCPLSLKKSMGLVRGKNDRIDARRIGDYARLHAPELAPWKPATKDLRALALLLATRDQRVRMKVMLKNSAPMKGEHQGIACANQVETHNQELLISLKAQIKAIEKEINTLICNSAALKPLYENISSVPGAGLVLCSKLLVKTVGFTVLTDPKKLACFAGVVPFENQSGTSLRGRSKLSFMGNKELKKLLHLGAMSAIRLKGELRDYYQRKVAGGKEKMSVLNAVRNKIIQRICAVAQSGKPYDPRKINLATS